MDITQHVHQTQRIDGEHEHEQDGHEAETVVNHKLRQGSTGQAEQIAYRLAVSDAVSVRHGQQVLVVRTGKEETDIRQQGYNGKSEHQNTDDHTCLTGSDESFERLPRTTLLHFDGSLSGWFQAYISRF